MRKWKKKKKKKKKESTKEPKLEDQHLGFLFPIICKSFSPPFSSSSFLFLFPSSSLLSATTKKQQQKRKNFSLFTKQGEKLSHKEAKTFQNETRKTKNKNKNSGMDFFVYFLNWRMDEGRILWLFLIPERDQIQTHK